MVSLKGRRAETNIIGASGIPIPHEIIRRQLQGKFLERRDSLFWSYLERTPLL